jgi:hypothetical protein
MTFGARPKAHRQDARRPRQRGAFLAFTGMALLTLVGMTVVGVDLGRLAFTATEVQTVAEVAATGYAHAWLEGIKNGGADPGDGACAADALRVVRGNRIDAKQAANANIERYERGFYDPDTSGPFTTGVPAGKTPNAVRATATTTVDNFFASVFGAPKSVVRKTAVATVTCGNRAKPLPLIVQDCSFGGFDGPDECAELPRLTQQNVHVENTCWTSLSSSDSAGVGRPEDGVRSLIEQYCCSAGPGNCPVSPDYPEVSEGQDIRVMNGQASLLKAMQQCWDNGFREFLVPITRCGTSCSRTNEVSGFANFKLTARPTTTGPDKSMSISAFCNANPEIGGWGGTCRGDYKVAMVE